MTSFDPYHKWLGIPPEQQPPNHYRLLGLEQFESDSDTISNAADQRMAHVRSFQTGQNSEVSQRILNEIAAARVCLLDPTKKFAYDVGLKDALRPVVTPVVNQRPASKMNRQMVLLALGVVAVCVLVVVLLLSRSKPTMARPPVAEKPTQRQEALPTNRRNEPMPDSKQEPQPVVETTPAIETKGEATLAPQTVAEGSPPINASPESATLVADVGQSAGYIDLLSRVDLDRDVVSGKWTREGGGLAASPKSRVRLPVKVNGGYDLLVTFTRSKGNGDVALLLPVGSHQCALFFSAWKGQVHGLDIIDGQDGVKNPINTRPGPLANGQQYTALVKVRLTKDKNASIEALLDNSPIVRWQGKETSLVLREDRTIPPYQIGLSAWDAVATFHSARFRLVSGNASWIGGGEIIAQAAPTESGGEPLKPQALQTRETGLPSGAVLIFTFDKNSVVRRGEKLYVRDLSGHGNDGLVNGAQLVEGCVGTGVSIAGPADYVECPDNKSLNPTAFTICTWAKVRSWQPEGYLVSKEDWEGGGERGYVLRCWHPRRVVDLIIGGAGWRDVFSDIGLELGKWYHVAATYDGKQAAVFVNGVKRGSTALKQPIAHSRYNLRVGGGTFDKRRTFDGIIDELAIFGRALTDAEVQSVYQMGLNGKGLQWKERVEGDMARLPVPDKASQDKARAQTKELFGKDHAAAKGSPEKLSALAARMTQQAAEITITDGNAAGVKYALLDIARTISIEAGDITLAVQAVDRMSETFQIDTAGLRGESVESIVKSAQSPQQINVLLESLTPLIEEYLADDDFAMAKTLGRAASTLARKSRDGGIVKQVTARNREIEELERVYQKDIMPAVEALKQNPDNPVANLIVGKYTCFTKGDWRNGLPKLAVGEDATIRELASKEVAGLSEPSDKLKVADGWWELAQKDEKHKQQIQAHAADLYQQLPGLSGIDKMRAEQRIKQSNGNDAGYRPKINGKIYAACDDSFIMYVNGHKVLEGGLRMVTADYAFARGDIITVKATNAVAGKRFCCAIKLENGETIVSGPRWSGYIPASQEEWYKVKGATYRVAPSPPLDVEQVKDIQAAAKVKAMPIWGQGNPCYLMLRVK